MYQSGPLEGSRSRLNPNSTGFSTSSRGSGVFNLPHHKKCLSQLKIKRKPLPRDLSNRNMIESMYRSGRFFRYEIGSPYNNPTHKSHLSMIENRSRSMIPDVEVEKNRLVLFKEECKNLRTELKSDYRQLKQEMEEEVNALQLRFMQSLSKQKIENADTRAKLKDAGKDFVETKNLIAELKIRIDSLKLRIDGLPMFNEDGRPDLNTKID